MNVRRNAFLSGLAATAAGAGIGGTAAVAQTPGRIDVHHHYSSPEWASTLQAINLYAPAWKGWSVEADIAEMDRNGVQRAMLSVTTPGVWFGDGLAARRLARECNEFAAKMVAARPRRFGMFVVLPLPDVKASLAEITYGMDTLKADGVGLLTSYGGKWLGDPYYEPIMQELDRRKAVVFVHPTTGPCCTRMLHEVPDSSIEYGTDTTRAIAQLIFSGTSRKYPNVRMIFSHGGGTMPFLQERFVNLEAQYKTVLPEGFLAEARRFYYDTAQVTMPAPLAALKKIVPTSHVLFGTDYPYLTMEENVGGLKSAGVYTAAELALIDRPNAVALLGSG
jgi:predicted TIM-barrel fold metal-dependent hydrolase